MLPEKFDGFLDKVLEFIREKFFGIDENAGLKNSAHSDCAAVLLAEAKHPELYFYLQGNHPIKSLCELADVLNSIDDAAFAFHVSEGRNDFAKWIANIVGDKRLAEKIEQLDTRQDIAKAVNIRVEFLKGLQ